MIRYARFLIPAGGLVLLAAGLTEAAEPGPFDGYWNATFSADGPDPVYCQIGQMWGEIVVRGGTASMKTDQNGVAYSFEGRVDAAGNLRLTGDWQPGTDSLITVARRKYTLKGRFQGRRFTGTFSGMTQGAATSACFGKVEVRFAAPLPESIAAAGAASAIAAAIPAHRTVRAPVRTAEAPATIPDSAVGANRPGPGDVADASGVTRGLRIAPSQPPTEGAAAEETGQRGTETPAADSPPASDAGDADLEDAQEMLARFAAAPPPAAVNPRRVAEARRVLRSSGVARVVSHVNNAQPLTLEEQEILFRDLAAPHIVRSLRASRSTRTRRIGETLARVAAGQEISQLDMQNRLSVLGVQGAEALTYLALFAKTRKHARTKLYSGAVRELGRGARPSEPVIHAPPPESRPSPSRRPRKLALLIGVQDYAEPIPDLKTPVSDIEALGRNLRRNFGYRVRTLRNPGHGAIVAALQDLVNEAGPQDSVVIMYAGHGYVLESSGMGYWLPADAAVNSASAWISNRTVTTALREIPARRVMLIADSCYSGSLLNGPTATAEALPDGGEGNRVRSVVIMTSGGEEPVQDGGGEGHSVFARQLMNALNAVQGNRPGRKVYYGVRAETARRAPQVPRYGGVPAAGHRAGSDYVFRGRAGPAPAVAATEIISGMPEWALPAGGAVAVVVVLAGGIFWRRRLRAV